MPQALDRSASAPLVTSQQLGRLRSALSDGEDQPILIVIHDYPDPDALASALALQTLSRSWGIASTIAYGGGIGRPENNAMVKLLHIEMMSFAKITSLAEYKGVLLVDTQPSAQNQSLPPEVPVLGVIDHHRISDDSLRFGLTRRGPSKTSVKNFTDIRLAVGASSTLVYGYLTAAGMVPDTRLATALFFGIMTDTDSLLRDTTIDDIAAYTRLIPLADMQLIFGMSRPPLSKEYFGLLHSAIENANIIGHCLIADCGEIEAPDIISTISDLMIRKAGILYSLAHGAKQGRHYFSLRAKPPREDATRIMLELLGSEGRGGGHSLSAGGFLEAGANNAAVLLSARQRFLVATGVEDAPEEALL